MAAGCPTGQGQESAWGTAVRPVSSALAESVWPGRGRGALYGNAAFEPTHQNCRNPHALEPMLHNKISHHNEKPMHCNEEDPCSLKLEKNPHLGTKTQHSPK